MSSGRHAIMSGIAAFAYALPDATGSSGGHILYALADAILVGTAVTNGVFAIVSAIKESHSEVTTRTEAPKQPGGGSSFDRRTFAPQVA